MIASYRWPQVLAPCLASALDQTVADIEVLVVEDGSDTASREVVHAAADPRVRWLAVQPNSGSQSGPNAEGRRQARAPVVAYLGHDDLWHPEHLADLLGVLGPDVDLAHAISLFLGADDDTRLEVAGSTAWTPDAFVPPSSIAHWRDSPRVGAWAGAAQSGLPVDYAFLMASHLRGVRCATTGRPTVFKHPAAWRADSYRTLDATPLLAVRDALAADPAHGQQLLARALAAGAKPDLPAPPFHAPGVIADYNRRMKGLPARFASKLTRWDPATSLPFPGWHAPERDEVGAFAWTGTQPRAVVRLDPPGAGRLGVRIVVRHVLRIDQLEALVVELDGTPVTLDRRVAADGAAVLEGALSRPAAGPVVEVALTAPTFDVQLERPGSPDHRHLGIAVAEIALT